MTTSKTIWLINAYASTPETGMGGRHYYLAQELAKSGDKVYVIASSDHHLHSEQPRCNRDIQLEKISDNFNFVWIKGVKYPEAHSKKRVANWFLFAWRLRKLRSVLPEEPDVILCSSPSIISFLGAEWLAKRSKAKLVFEVRDIWPLTLTEVGGHSPRHPLIRFMQWVEDRAYRKSKRVVSNLKNSVEHMIQHGMDRSKFAWIPNGYSLSEVNQKEPLLSSVAQLIPRNKFVIGYTGSLGLANALSALIEAAEILSEYEDIVFVLVGHGKEKNALKQNVECKKLKNVIFVDTIPKVQIQSMLEKFDACYLGLKGDPLFRFGVSPNKLYDYMYSAKPIIYAIESGDYKPVEDAKAGIQVQPENPHQLAKAILSLYQTPVEERQLMGNNGRKAAAEMYEYGKLACKLRIVLFEPGYPNNS
ncbi:MAG: glycosyltransferase family 4 protein [Burkholderiaceae bacterium]|nr:glycosyltransferase family 4 protein [Burkholderiaceae bacterium]